MHVANPPPISLINKLTTQISRRQFLQSSSLALLGSLLPRLPAAGHGPLFALGRVAVPVINIYSQPSFNAERIAKKERDDLLWLLERIEAPDGPPHNPIWYRTSIGYAHSGRIQFIPLCPPNSPLDSLPPAGLLGEVTVPFSRSMQYSSSLGWIPLYRLYASSLHRLVSIDTGPNCLPWYRLQDDLMNAQYFVDARHIRPLDPAEFAPLGVNIPSAEKRLVVSISQQSLTAYAGTQPVFRTTVSSGLHSEDPPEDEIPTDTPTGSFRIQLKMPSRHMGDGRLTSNPQAYELPGVPWTMVFTSDGIALHGTYWHNNFGTRMSHGCLNLRNADALWLFRWTDPAYTAADYYVKGIGTLVQVYE